MRHLEEGNSHSKEVAVSVNEEQSVERNTIMVEEESCVISNSNYVTESNLVDTLEMKLEAPEEVIRKKSQRGRKSIEDNYQLDFNSIAKDNLINEISSIDILSMNPMDAMNKLYQLVSEAKKLK